MGRTQGITTTGAVILIGALTSTADLAWQHIVYITVYAAVAHMALNVYIALGDTVLDSNTYVPSRNPVTEGILTEKQAKNFVYGSIIFCTLWVLGLALFIDFLFVLLTLVCFTQSFVWLIWYGWKGKKYLISYDYSFSVSYSFTVLFGVFAIGGMPTIYTWIFIGIVIFAPTAFAQWENGFKDVNADRSVGVRSLAVVTGVENNKRISVKHPYFIYGAALKVSFIIVCSIPYMLSNNLYYLLFLLIYGIPSQAFIMYRFATKEKAVHHRKTILLDVALSAILGFTAVVGKIGILWLFFVIGYLIVGYLIGSVVQSKCEFKFGRFNEQESEP
ncbi:MAG: UbiA family prenyltransferase [Candidatus Thermoplasmatota archaeon]